jgi:hypothetical protein
MESWLILLTLCTLLDTSLSGILYPRESESREVVSLDGIWKFVMSPTEDQEKGFRNRWFSTTFENVSEEGRFTNCTYMRSLRIL